MSDPAELLLRHRAPTEVAARRSRRPVRVRLTLALASTALLGLWALRPHPAPPTEDGQRIELVYRTAPGASVAVAGSFNDWDADGLPLTETTPGTYARTLELPPGEYEYQFIVDGETWVADPLASALRDDGFGAQNSVLQI